MFWGLTWAALANVCGAYIRTLFKLTTLPSPFFYAIFVAVEVILCAPVFYVVRRHWMLTTKKEVILWSLICCCCATQWIASEGATQRMPLNDFVAIELSGLAFSPLVACILRIVKRSIHEVVQ